MVAKLSLKLLADIKSNKFPLAKAGKDFVDFPFNLLPMPVGSATSLLTKQQMVGSMENLFESVKNISDTCIQQDQQKNNLLKPEMFSTFIGPNPHLLLQNHTYRTMHYSCERCNYSRYYIDVQGTKCPDCKKGMSTKFAYVGTKTVGVESDGEDGGYVNGVVTYMAMDDLVVTPMSYISIIIPLKKFPVNEVSGTRGENGGIR